MIESLTRFLVYNLGASVLGGLWALALVLVAMRIFGVTRAVTRNRLLTIPVIKSSLVLLGLCTVMPFPADTWRTVRANAVDFDTIAPVFLLLLGLLVLASPFVRSRVASHLLSDARPAHEGDRSWRALQEVMRGFETKGRLSCGGFRVGDKVPEPNVFESQDRTSVAIVDGSPPALLLPAPLVEELDDEELEGVLAHEVAHLALNRPRGCCDPLWLRPLYWLNPTSFAVGRLLAREEELACDELAARVTERPEALASALLKAYRFEKSERRFLPDMLTAHLVERKGLLKRRIERLTDGSTDAVAESPLRVWIVWLVVVVLVFASA